MRDESPLQSMVDSISDAARAERTKYHLTLGELIEELESLDSEKIVVFSEGGSPSNPHSYRGYYSDMGLEWTEDEKTAGEVYGILSQVYETELTGYKGGQFLMTDTTPLWRAEYGSSVDSHAIMDISEEEDEVILQCVEV